MTKLNAHRGINAHTADEGKLLLAICVGFCNQDNSKSVIPHMFGMDNSESCHLALAHAVVLL